MRDAGKIALGLAVFLIGASYPVWRGVAAAAPGQAPELELPARASECVEGVEYMRAHHAELLDDWRNAVVRDGEASYTSSTGARFAISLSGTCVECHGAAEAFCTRCHDYAAVQPTCWNCHIDTARGDAP